MTTVEFDGAVWGNPGPAAVGYVVESKNWREKEGKRLGEATNNVAEWTALLQGIKKALDRGCISVRAVGDSELVVKQTQSFLHVSIALSIVTFFGSRSPADRRQIRYSWSRRPVK